MAEYYPLLARAIAGLPQSTPDARRAIYDRARSALIGQLRAVQPPIAEDDIQRESRMLDDAIARLEQEIKASAPQPVAPPAPQPQAAPPQNPAPQNPPPPPPPKAAPQAAQTAAPQAAQPAAPEAPGPADAAARRTEPPVVRPTMTTAPRSALPPRPNLPPRPGAAAPVARPAGLGGLEAARQRLASLAKPGPIVKPSPAQGPGAPDQPAPRDQKPVDAPQPPQVAMPAEAREPASKPSPAAPVPPKPAHPISSPSAPVRNDQAGAGAPPVEAARPVPTEAAVAAASRLAADVAADQSAERRDGAAPVNITLRKYGPRAEAAGVSADFAPIDEPGDEPRMGGVRPSAPLPPEDKERNFRPLLIGLPVALVVGAIAVFAYMRRDNPEELVRLRPAPGAEAPAEQSSGKIVERIGGSQGQRPAEAPAPQQTPAQPQQAQPTQPAQGPAAPTSAIPVSQRAALLVDAPDEPQRVRTYVGNVVWRLDNVSRGPGQPLAIGVRAEIDLPDAKLKAIILLQKNSDETLPASHTMEVRFAPIEGGPIPGVAQISTPQMRKEDTPAGDALAGVPAPILRNFFLVGLSRGEAQVSRNLDLLRNRGWIDIPMLLSDQRIAKITFEKGTAGERVINEALDAWK